jgi:DNA-binding MarR family transcriptional regulator
MYSVWLSDDEQRVWRGYLTMVSGLAAEMHRQLQLDCGLSLSDYDVLVVLSERGGLRMYQLADELAWEQSRLSHQLRRMGGRGLVLRHGSPSDRRGVTVELTPAGRAALDLAAPGHAALVRSLVFDGMPPARLREFGALIDTVLGRLTSPPRHSE